MSILSGFKKYKDYILTSSGYQLSSRWTKSDAVVMGDGTDDTNTLEKNLGSIQGITDSLTATSSNVALSAAGGNNLQGQIDTINSNLSYSVFDTEELLSNTFNNKPLYRKRLYKSNVALANGLHIIDGTLLPTYVGTIVNLSASAAFSSGEKTMLPFVGGDNAYTRVVVDSRGLVIYNGGVSGNITEYFVEIVYTKE